MKKIILLLSLCFIGLIISCTNSTTISPNNLVTLNDKNDSITIQGRVFVKGSDLPPVGINTVNISNKWNFYKKSLNAKGENQRVFVDTKGYYNIKIQKGDTLQFIPYSKLYKNTYKNYKLHGLDKSQTINFTVDIDSILYYKLQKDNSLSPFTYLDLNPDKLFKTSGVIINKDTKKPMENVLISSVHDSNTLGNSTHCLTDENGKFSLNLPDKSLILIDPLNPLRQQILVTKDTILTIYH